MPARTLWSLRSTDSPPPAGECLLDLARLPLPRMALLGLVSFRWVARPRASTRTSSRLRSSVASLGAIALDPPCGPNPSSPSASSRRTLGSCWTPVEITIGSSTASDGSLYRSLRSPLFCCSSRVSEQAYRPVARPATNTQHSTTKSVTRVRRPSPRRSARAVVTAGRVRPLPPTLLRTPQQSRLTG